MALLSSALSSCVPADLHHRSTAIAGHDSRLLAVGAVPSPSKFAGVHGRIHHVAKSALRAALTADAPSAKPDTDFLSYKTELLVIIHISLSCTNCCSFCHLLGCPSHHVELNLGHVVAKFWYLHSHGCHGSWGRFWKFREFGGETQDSSRFHFSNEYEIQHVL
jgi:hypothetical protein